MQRVRSGDVDFPVQRVGKVQSQPRKVKEAASRLELDQEVYVAGFGCFSPGDRSEHARSDDAVPAHQGGYSCSDIVDGGAHGAVHTARSRGGSKRDDSAGRADAVADGEDGVEVVVVEGAGYQAGALGLNYPEIPDSCPRTEVGRYYKTPFRPNPSPVRVPQAGSIMLGNLLGSTRQSVASE